MNVELPAAFFEALADRVVDRLEIPAPAADTWLDVEVAARHLGYGDEDEAKLKRGCTRVYDLKARGLIEFRKDGSRLVFRRSWLDAYLERTD